MVRQYKNMQEISSKRIADLEAQNKSLKESLAQKEDLIAKLQVCMDAHVYVCVIFIQVHIFALCTEHYFHLFRTYGCPYILAYLLSSPGIHTYFLSSPGIHMYLLSSPGMHT